MKKIYILIVLMISAILVSCRKDEEIPVAVVKVVTDTIKPSCKSVYVGCHVECNVPFSGVKMEIAKDEKFEEVQDIGMVRDSSAEARSAYVVDKASDTRLEYNTKYYFRYLVTNNFNTIATEADTFRTMDISVPELQMNNVENVTESTADVWANIVSDGGDTIRVSGFCYSQSAEPNIVYNDTVEVKPNSSGILRRQLKNFEMGKSYHVRAFAVNGKGVGYSNEMEFRTPALPEVETEAVSSITMTSAVVSGTVISDGGTEVTERGVCYSTSSNPTISNSKVSSGSGTGSFSCTLSGLSAGTTYYVRAYAKNSMGTAYGEQKTFTIVSPSAPTVNTNDVSNITRTSGTCGGNVTDDGGATVTERGLCWGKGSLPTISTNKLTLGTGTGSFSGNITGLTANTTYYVRAYATNSKGTSYGSSKVLKTLDYDLPTVTTSTINTSYVYNTSATVSGNVTADGGATVTTRGVCYSTSSNPTISNSKVASGNGTGSFSVTLSGLSSSTTYYIRAYATNSKGTAYGEQLSFTTLSSSSSDIPVGAIAGLFSVSATEQVYFSQGNLQYQASTNTWRFAENQYDYVGDSINGTVYQSGVKCNNAKISSTYSGWIDLFGWGTGNNPTLSSTSYSDYSTFTDWGINPISNGGNEANQWRTLTIDEWVYLFSGRTNATNLRSQATVNNVQGYIFLPDNWSSFPIGLSFTANAIDWTTNTYSAADWAKMEQSGAVFLPAAGYRYGRGVYDVGSYGRYWSSTPFGENSAYYMRFLGYLAYPQGKDYSRGYGRPVRLVR